MNEKQINRSIKQAFNHATPDVLDAVLSDCREQKGTVIVMKRRNNLVRWAGAVAAVLALLIGIGGYQLNNAVASTISLDVNPSISIMVNRNERVLDVDALNKDAQIVLGDMDLEGSDVDVAINAIIGSMVRNGYINELSNSILVSVESRDAAAGEALQAKLTREINDLLKSDKFSGAVLSQTVNKEDELQVLADKYGITIGKAQLIQQIIKQNTRYRFEDLVKLSINQLNLISESGGLHLDNITSAGTASDKSYIGAEAARDLALSSAGLRLEQINALEVEMKLKNGVMIYEVEFDADTLEYDFNIDAANGTIISVQREYRDDPASAPEPIIDRDAALNAALSHAGVSKDDAYDAEVDLEITELYYDVEFEAGEYAYSYHIDGRTGSVLRHTKDRNADGSEITPPDGLIRADLAIDTALAHAGLTRDQVTNLSCELDKDDGMHHYDVEFHAGGYDYEYKIGAYGSGVAQVEKEKLDEPVQTPPAVTPPAAAAPQTINRETALQAALTHAGLTVDQVSETEVELDSDDGLLLYEIEFRNGNMEYSYEIDAATGAVIAYEKELDD